LLQSIVGSRFEDVQAFREEIERLEREHPGTIDRRQISLLEDERDAEPDA